MYIEFECFAISKTPLLGETKWVRRKTFDYIICAIVSQQITDLYLTFLLPNYV